MAGSIGEQLSGRDNALNSIRLVLALAVIVAHSWPLTGRGVGPGISGLDIGGWAVAAFFAVSGFLIARSRSRLRAREFFARRCRRIFPALWLALVLTGWVLAPLIAAMNDARFDWTLAGFYPILNAGLIMVVPTIGDTLQGHPYTASLNGSLWTLEWEFAAYVVAAVFVGASWVRRRPLLPVLGLHVLFVLWALVEREHPFPWLGVMFTGGMVVWAAGHRLRATWPLVALAAGLIVALSIAGYARAAGGLPVAYFVIALGALLPTRLGATNDLSYGTYVLAFPVQQTLQAAGVGAWGLLPFATISAAVVLPLAAASWFLVERPALSRGIHPSWQHASSWLARVRSRCATLVPRRRAGVGGVSSGGREEAGSRPKARSSVLDL